MSEGLDGSDKLLGKWVSEKFRATYSDLDTLHLQFQSEELIEWLAQCAWQLRDDKLAVVFDPDRKNGNFWSDASSQFEEYEKASSGPKARTIDSSGNVVEVGPKAGQSFIPRTNRLDLSNLTSSCSGSGCALEPQRVAGVLALLFVDGEKVLAQVSQEQVAKLEGEIAAKKMDEADEMAATVEKGDEALATMLEIYNAYLTGFPVGKRTCEPDMAASIKQAVAEGRQEAAQVATVAERDGLNTDADETERLAALLARAGCFVKFYVEYEGLVFGKYFATPEEKVFDAIRTGQLTDAGKKALQDGLMMSHQDWLAHSVDVGDKSIEAQAMVGFRAKKYLDEVYSYAQVFILSPKFGCRLEESGVVCDPQ